MDRAELLQREDIYFYRDLYITLTHHKLSNWVGKLIRVHPNGATYHLHSFNHHNEGVVLETMEHWADIWHGDSDSSDTSMVNTEESVDLGVESK